MSQLEPGTVIQRRYTIERLIGRGGMASVYVAHDSVLDREVAIKVLHPPYRDDALVRRRFLREAKAAAQLAHPNIVQVHDRGDDGGGPFIVMEYIEGVTIHHLLVAGERLPEARALAIARQAADALAYAHDQGIVHRDVKPQNMIVDGDGVLHLADFGIARMAGDIALSSQREVIGTPAYLSPEQVRGLPATPASDVYALGIVLYEMLTGDPPFDGDAPTAIARMHATQEPTPLRTHRPDVSEATEQLVAALLVKDPDQRPRTATAALRRIDDVLRAAVAGYGTGSIEQITLGSRPDPPGLLRTGTPPDRSPIRWRAAASSQASLRRRVGTVCAGAIVFALGFMSVGTLEERVGPQAPTVTGVPDVRGQQLAQARELLEAEGVTVTGVERRAHGDRPGLVLGQRRVAEAGSDDLGVRLVVSDGPATVAVPLVVGSGIEDARRAVALVGLQLDVVDVMHHDALPGRIARQDPTVGALAPVGSTVSVVLSLGPDRSRDRADRR